MDDPEDYQEYMRQEGETYIEWGKRLLGDDWEPREELTPKEPMAYFGQEGAKQQLAPFIGRDEPFPNTLILGRPGIGKTRLARWIAEQRREMFEEFLCPVNPDSLPNHGIVMLDEAHRQRHPEWLWAIMDSDVAVLAATTRPEQLEQAFKSRFMLTIHLKRYSDDSMKEMALSILPMNDEDAELYASASAGNPRQLELILSVAKELGPSNHNEVLGASRITADGLTEYHVDLLRALDKAGRPIGLSTLSGMLYSDDQTVKEHEAFLIEEGLMSLRTNGRLITRDGRTYMARLEQTA